MTAVKSDLKRDRDKRMASAIAVLKPQWRQCNRTQPRGHIRDGSHNNTCLYCGDLGNSYPFGNVVAFEYYASIAHTYPIANEIPKDRLTSVHP